MEAVKEAGAGAAFAHGARRERSEPARRLAGAKGVTAPTGKAAGVSEANRCHLEPIFGKGVKFERIRRITGYLVGTLDRFNNAKRAEEKDRVKHDRKD